MVLYKLLALEYRSGVLFHEFSFLTECQDPQLTGAKCYILAPTNGTAHNIGDICEPLGVPAAIRNQEDQDTINKYLVGDPRPAPWIGASSVTLSEWYWVNGSIKGRGT